MRRVRGLKKHDFFPETVLALRGSDGFSRAEEMSAGSAGGWRSRENTAIYSTWCMSRRSRAGETLGGATFDSATH